MAVSHDLNLPININKNKHIRKKLNKLKLFNLKSQKLTMELQTELPAEAHPAEGQ
jgi:hypothetical protein